MEAEKDAASNQLQCTAAAAAAAAAASASAGAGDADTEDDADTCDAVCVQAVSAASSTVSLFTTFSDKLCRCRKLLSFSSNAQISLQKRSSWNHENEVHISLPVDSV